MIFTIVYGVAKKGGVMSIFLLDDKPIIKSPLETDFYKYPMGQAISRYHPNIHVKVVFINRTKDVRLADMISIERLKEELDHAFSLKHENSDLHYLRGTNEYDNRMFDETFLNSLREPPKFEYELGKEDGQFKIEVAGNWMDAMRAEIFVLKIVNALYVDALFWKLTRKERIAVSDEAQRRLEEKVRLFKLWVWITFADFGNRRAANPLWHEYVVRFLKENLSPEQFLGTSNVYLAQRYNLMPIGTMAHELYIVLSALYDNLAESQKAVLNMWWELYGRGLSIALPDTYGTDFFLEHVFTPELARLWKGSRQDSGDPFAYGEKLIAYYKKHHINPMEKIIIPSNGLVMEEMRRIGEYFKGRINVSFAPGTSQTFDLPGFKPVSIIMKPFEANGVALSKLSDDIGKATGTREAIKRDMIRAGYTNTYSTTPTY